MDGKKTHLKNMFIIYLNVSRPNEQNQQKENIEFRDTLSYTVDIEDMILS